MLVLAKVYSLNYRQTPSSAKGQRLCAFNVHLNNNGLESMRRSWNVRMVNYILEGIRWGVFLNSTRSDADRI